MKASRSNVEVPRPAAERLRLVVTGAVQGVGFRPFAQRLAGILGLNGCVKNTSQGVTIEIEGPRADLEKFLHQLGTDKPPRSIIQSVDVSWIAPVGSKGFEIRPSEIGGEKIALVLPDIATCPDCLREIMDPNNRRFRYPFTNCTRCGPRFSIIEALPYDRANTSMRSFIMCPLCQAEYDNPIDRRFHAQPNACPACGPRLEFWDKSGECAATEDDALRRAADAIRRGRIVAAKGIGGFQLLVAGHDECAVRRLRERKQREEKALAVMFPSLDSVKTSCEVTALEETLLCSPEAPIVLLRRGESHLSNPKLRIAAAVAPGNPLLGAMVPYTPLHMLLLAELGFPVVATSGNRSDEPICTDEREALERIGDIADDFLVHNRRIVRPMDDSIVRVIAERALMLRRARGFAPLPIQIAADVEPHFISQRSQRAPHIFAGGISFSAPQPCGGEGSGEKVRQTDLLVPLTRGEGIEICAGPNTVQGSERRPSSPSSDSCSVRRGGSVLAVGAHFKNTVALAIGRQVFIGQHIGDLETASAFEAFRRVAEDLPRLYDVRPEVIATDAHPDYLPTQFARQRAARLPTARLATVQHHYAHILSCMTDNELEAPVLGVCWDGTGYGADGTIWGGEFLRVNASGFERVAHLRTFPLPGGDRAMREPRRAALGLLYEWLGQAAFSQTSLPAPGAFSEAELRTLRQMLSRSVNSPLTSSVGRLFDAVASLTGLRQLAGFEGQAAMELEFAAVAPSEDGEYKIELRTGVLDWVPMIDELCRDVRERVETATIAAKFHHALVEGIVAIAHATGEEHVALSGGCFQNKYLTERAVRRLREEGFQPYWHQRVPPNDGGIALGQVVAVLRQKG